MPEDKLVLRIEKNGNKDTSLSSLNIEEADALISLITALRDLCNNVPDNKDLKIELKEGSAYTSLRGAPSSMAPIFDNFDEVINKTSKDIVDVESWRSIQSILQNERFNIEANIIKKGVKISIKEKVVEAKPFKRASSRTKSNVKLEFYSGKLNEIGGKKPNIHLLVDDSEIIVECSEADAIYVSSKIRLYQTVRIAAWTKINGKNEVIERKFSEVYFNDEDFELYRSLINSYKDSRLPAFIDKMYDISNPLLDNNKYSDFRKFMSLFNHKSWNLNVLKTMLVISKDFYDVPQIDDLRKRLNIFYLEQKNRLKNIKNKNKGDD